LNPKLSQECQELRALVTVLIEPRYFCLAHVQWRVLVCAALFYTLDNAFLYVNMEHVERYEYGGVMRLMLCTKQVKGGNK